MNVKSLSSVICFNFTVYPKLCTETNPQVTVNLYSTNLANLLILCCKEGVLVNHFETKL